MSQGKNPIWEYLHLLTFINIKSTNIYRFIQVHILTRGYNDKSHVLSVSAETEISTFGRSLFRTGANLLSDVR